MVNLSPDPNPTSLFKWEDSSSLEHACWACPAKSNSPKALHSCYGIHSMPCLAYHSTMHAIGAAHRCSACISGREIHENRHREIAQLVADYHAVANTDTSPCPRRRTLQERPANAPFNMQFHEAGLDDIESENEDEPDNDDRGENALTLDDNTSTTTSSEGAFKLTKAEKREIKRAVKVQKSMDKAAKSQARHFVKVTSEDVQHIDTILHGDETSTERDTHPLATDKTIEDVIARNLGFVKQIETHNVALKQQVARGRKDDKERKRHKRRMSEGVRTDSKCAAVDVIDAILSKLGVDKAIIADTANTVPTGQNGFLNTRAKHRRGKSISKTPSRSPQMVLNVGRASTPTTPGRGDATDSAGIFKKTGARGESMIVYKLRDAIRDDLEKHENDLRQTYIRAGGFFRYAGKQVFERMTEIAGRIDIQTGEPWEKKFKRENPIAAPVPELEQNQGQEDEQAVQDEDDLPLPN